jgi:putative ABC transport system ATP-binding protein
LTRTFGRGPTQTTALDEVSLDLYPGQVTLLMGPSGSGKSTLLAILSGLLQPDSGQVIALGEDLWRLSDRARHGFRMQHCGFVFQGYNLFPALSARQQLEMVLRWARGVPARTARQQAAAMLSVMGLAGKADLRPAELSGGEKQRVAIARALIKEPTFCFADEPTGSLDWAHGRQVVESLCDTAHTRGATVLLVSHDARTLAYVDRVYQLEDGRLRELEDGATHGSPPRPG